MCETWKARRLATVLQSAFTSQEITGDVEKIYEYLVSRFPSVLISRPGDIPFMVVLALLSQMRALLKIASNEFEMRRPAIRIKLSRIITARNT